MGQHSSNLSQLTEYAKLHDLRSPIKGETVYYTLGTLFVTSINSRVKDCVLLCSASSETYSKHTRLWQAPSTVTLEEFCLLGYNAV
jgi:hypothetical protein